MSLLEIDGRAAFNKLEARTEGKGDSKILVVDLKMSIVAPNDVLIHFHPQLRLMMFDKDGKPRFPVMGAIPWSYEFPNQYVEIHPDVWRPLKLHGCRLKNFSFFAMDAGKVRLGFTVHVRPSEGDFEIMGRVLAQAVTLQVRNDNLDLFAKPKAPPERKVPEEPELPLEEPTREPQAAAPEEPPPPLALPVATAPTDVVLAEPPAPLDPADPNAVPAFNPAGTPLGIRLDKRKHPVGGTYEDNGTVYDITGQGEKSITLSARYAHTKPAAAEPAAPQPEVALEVTEKLLVFMKTAGSAEAMKIEDDRDFDTGFTIACRSAGLTKAFVEDNLTELQSAFTDGYDAELTRAEGPTA